jgi:hypothetical protein
MSSKALGRFVGPLGTAILAVVVTLSWFIRPNSTSDLGPIDLRSGAVQTVRFRAGYSEQYAIGLEMDQQIAKRLFPCMVDGLWFNDHRANCLASTHAWPASLSFTLWADGIDLTGSIDVNTAEAGGQYGGDETYTWQPAFAELQRGKTYKLIVHSLTDGTTLLPARPRLVVAVNTVGFSDQEMLRQLGTFLVASTLALVSAAWAIISRKANRRTGKAVV